MAGVMDFLFGSEDKYNKLETMAPEQKQLFHHLKPQKV